MLLAFVLGCGDEYEPDCNQPMPSTDEDGAPWPSYSVASSELADCGQIEDYYLRRNGSCSDGKRFLDKGSGFVGDTLYFDGETIVGRYALQRARGGGDHVPVVHVSLGSRRRERVTATLRVRIPGQTIACE
jgi:hypothetical protein